MVTDDITRDSIRDNVDVLVPCANVLGMRVGIKTLQVHIQACYDLMKIPCPRSSSLESTFF